MLLYYPFWMFMGFILHIYIIFGTNLLTGGPSCIAIFLPISVYRRKGISNGVQTERNLRERDFGTNVIQRTWSASQEAIEEATRVEGAPPLVGRTPCLVGPLGVHRRTSSSYIYTYTPKPSRVPPKKYFRHRNLLYPRDPILEPSPVFCRRGNPPRKASTSTP